MSERGDGVGHIEDVRGTRGWEWAYSTLCPTYYG